MDDDDLGGFELADEAPSFQVLPVDLGVIACDFVADLFAAPMRASRTLARFLAAHSNWSTERKDFEDALRLEIDSLPSTEE